MTFDPSRFYPDPAAPSSSSSSSPAPETPFLRKDELAGALEGLDPPGDGATQKAVRQGLASLIGRLKSVAPVIFCAALVIICAILVPCPAVLGGVPWEEVPPDTPVDLATVGADLGFTNDFLRAEADPTIPAWAKASLPPTNGFLRVESDPVFETWRGDSTSTFEGTAASAGIAAEASSAGSADYASSAGSADYASSAGSADYASSAGYADSAGSASSADYATSADSAATAYSATSADSASTAGYSEEAGHASGATHAEEAVGLYWTSGDGTLYTASEIVALASNDAVRVLEAYAATNPPPDLSAYATRADLAAATQRVARASSSLAWATGPLSLAVGASLSADLAGWPDGAAVFVRLSASGPYTVAPSLSLLGYGSWPTNSASCVAVRDGQRVLVNVLEGF